MKSEGQDNSSVLKKMFEAKEEQIVIPKPKKSMFDQLYATDQTLNKSYTEESKSSSEDNKLIQKEEKKTNNQNEVQFYSTQRWTKDEDRKLTEALLKYRNSSWQEISNYVGTRSRHQWYSRYAVLYQPKSKKVNWTKEDNQGN